MENRLKRGNGEILACSIISVCLCSLVLIIGSFLQLSKKLNTLQKASIAASRVASISSTKEEAKTQAESIAKKVLKSSTFKNTNISISYIEPNAKWEPGNYICVKISGDIKTITPFTSGEKFSEIIVPIEGVSGYVVTIPKQYGKGNVTYTNYEQTQWTPGTTQKQLYDLWVSKGRKSKDGVATIDDMYIVALTNTFGAVGDKVIIYLEDERILNCVIGDEKNQDDEKCNMWGHNDGQDIIEVESVHQKNNPWGKVKPIKIVNAGKYI